MNNIGQRIKELRKKHDMTQEKLADYLSVTHKAVSKWECGVTVPDLALIVPLARVLHVTTDELLGNASSEVHDERKAFFEAEYHEYWMKTDHNADLKIAQQAVAEYPAEYKYLEWLASVEWYVGYSVENIGTEKFDELIESSIRHYQIILDDCKDMTIRNQAVSGIVYDLCVLERYDEAKKYAEMYPDKPETSRDELIARCLKGEKRSSMRRKIAYDKFKDFCYSLSCMYEYFGMNSKKAREIQESIIRLVIDDNNYLEFNGVMYSISMSRASDACAEKKYDDAVRYLCDAREYAIGFDQFEEKGLNIYTCTLFEGCVKDVRDSRNECGTYIDWFRETLQEKDEFAPLRDRDDFKALLQ